MLNKNDPLIGAVQEVMKRNHAEREAARLVNEKFGVQDRKALPHEKQSAWDSAYKQVLSEGLHPNQQKLDVHEPEKDELTKHDFKMLHAKKKSMEEDVTSPSSMGIKKPDYAPAGTTPDYAKPKEQTVNRAAKTSLPAGTMKEAKVNPYAVGMAAVKKSTGDEPPMEKKNITKAHKIAKKIIAKRKVNEGFNNRHGLSENASAEKQAVAVLNEDDIDSYENRMTAGLGQQYTPYGGGRFGGGGAKTGRIGAANRVRIDPGLKYTNTATGKKLKQTDIPRKKRTFVKKNSQTAQQQGPAKPPSGTFLDNLARGRRNVGTDRPAAPSLAAGAARRPPGTSTVPQIRQTGPSTGSNLPSGPWGNIRRGGASPRPTGLAAGAARRSAGQSAPPVRQQGSMLPAPKSKGGLLKRGGAALAAGAALDLATSSTSVGNQPPSTSAATGPEKIKTSTQTTTTQPDYDKMTFGQAFKTARQQAGGAGGKFKYKGKEYQTNIKGTGTAKKPQEKYQPASKLKDVTPVPATKTSTSVVGGQGVAAVPGGKANLSPTPNVKPARNSTLAAPSATAATTMATATKAAGQMAVDRMKAQNLAKSQTSSMFGGSVNKPKPLDTTRDIGKYAGDMRDTRGPAAAERLANPTFVPRPSPGTVRRNSTLAAPSAIAAKPASSPMASQGSSGATQSKILPQRKSSGGGSGGGGGGGY